MDHATSAANSPLHGRSLRVTVKPSSRVLALDGIRGIAILLVLLQHFAPFFINAAPHALRSSVAAVCLSGWIGVDIFFVLSGFLITEILLRMKTARDFWLSFYIKRLFRIGPVFVVFCVPVALGMAWAKTLPVTQALLLLTPFANWAMMPDGLPYLSHLWSLAVEEQFYLFWPFVIRACKIEKVRNVALWISVGSVAAHFVGTRLRVPVGSLYRSTITHIVGISLGAALATVNFVPSAKLMRLSKSAFYTGAFMLVADLAIARLYYQYDGILYASPYLSEVAMVATSLLTAGIVALAVVSRLPNVAQTVLSSSWLRWMGNRSYAIYIVHLILVEAYFRRVIPPFPRVAFVLLFGSLLIAEVSWRLIEAPALRLARRLTHRPESLLIEA